MSGAIRRPILSWACGLLLCFVVLGNAAPARRGRITAVSTALFDAVKKSDLPKVQALLAKGANPNASLENGYTPLMEAVDCRSGLSMPIVQALLAKGANVNAKTRDGRVVMHSAVYTRSYALIQALIRKGANVNVPEEYGQTPLERSVAMGDVAIVKLLLDSGAKLRLDKRSSPMLATAAHYGNVEIAKLLFAKGAQVNEDNGAALIAAADSGKAAMVKFLLSKGAAVNAKGERGDTALLVAARNGYLEAAQVLVAAGADVNVKDEEGSTPLSWATIAEMGQPENPLVKLLLEHGANPNAGSMSGAPLFWAAQNGESQAVQLLLDKGANPNAVGFTGTALLAVLREGNNQRALMTIYGFGGTMKEEEKNEIRRDSAQRDAAIVRALLDHGVDVTKGLNRGALILAAVSGNADIVQQLLDKGAPVNITDIEVPVLSDSPGSEAPQGVTPLMAAAGAGSSEVVGLLLDKGVDVNAKDRSGRTALMRVANEGRAQIVRVLPQMREGILHRADEDSEKPTSRDVSPVEKTNWQRWADSGDTAVVQALLAKNADINARDTKGQTALMLAAANSTPAVVQALLQAKAEINAQDVAGETALMHVIERGRLQRAPELVSFELQNSVRMMEGMAKHDNGAMAASMQKQAAAAKAALDRQKSAVLQEATAGDLALLRILIEGGADKEVRDKKGRTALSIATQKRYGAFVTFLQKAASKN